MTLNETYLTIKSAIISMFKELETYIGGLLGVGGTLLVQWLMK